MSTIDKARFFTEANSMTKPELRSLVNSLMDIIIYADDILAGREDWERLKIQGGIKNDTQKPVPTSLCPWRLEDLHGNLWKSDCGVSFVLTDDSPIDNGMKFCHSCGKPLKEDNPHA